MKTTEEKEAVRQSWTDAYDDEVKALMEGQWTVGEMDRGHGHMSYGVIMAPKPGRIFTNIIPNLPSEVAQHIVDLHNEEESK